MRLSLEEWGSLEKLSWVGEASFLAQGQGRLLEVTDGTLPQRKRHSGASRALISPSSWEGRGTGCAL